MLNKPLRQSLINQTAAALREGIASGHWKNFLPSERELCLCLQVSRPTLRSAVQILVQENCVSVQHGKRTAILKRRKAKLRSARRSVALVSKLPLHLMSRNRIYLIDYLQRALHEQELDLEIISHPGFGGSRPDQAIKHLADRGLFKAFVLQACSRSVQNWFYQQSLPAITMGSVFPEVSMPSVDVDYKMIGRHAAGLFLGKGHQRIIWALPEATHAGNVETERSFVDYVENANGNGATCQIIRYSASSQDLIQKVDELLDLKLPPTAFFIMESFATTTLVTHFLSKGMKIPDDVSLITRDYDELLRWITPDMAHYMPPLRRIGKRISNMVIELAQTGSLQHRAVHLMPDFFKGASLCDANKAP